MSHKVENNIDVNPFIYMNQAFQVDFRTDKNVLGASGIFKCPRQIVIEKIHEIETPPNMKMLFGKIIHQLCEYKPIRDKIVAYINNHFGIEGNSESWTEIQKLHEIIPEEDDEEKKEFRTHPDIFTYQYPIEIKTTGMPISKWGREVSVMNTQQLNMYICEYECEFGVLMVINKHAFMYGGSDWEYLLNNYCYTLRFEPDYEAYTTGLLLTKKLFVYINKEEYKSLPEGKSWECNYCYHETMKLCGKKEYKCQAKRVYKGKERKHYKKMVEYSKDLTDTFKEVPVCQACFEKAKPKSKYIKYKYKNYKDMVKNV